MYWKDDRELVQLRLAAALAHCLPDARVEITASGGQRLVVGFGDVCAITPCRFYAAVAAAMREGVDAHVCELLDLPAGPLSARLVESEAESWHVGAGVFRYAGAATWGHVFATTISPDQVRAIVVERSAPLRLGLDASGSAVTDGPLLTQERAVSEGRWFLVPSEEIGVTVCFSEFDCEGSVVAPAERLALDVAGACLVEELTRAGGP